MSQPDPASPQSPFLSENEVAELTGYKRRSAQAQWLTAKGFVFMLNAAGRPILHRSHVAAKLGGSETEPIEDKPWEPNLAAIRTREAKRRY